MSPIQIGRRVNPIQQHMGNFGVFMMGSGMMPQIMMVEDIEESQKYLSLEEMTRLM